SSFLVSARRTQTELFQLFLNPGGLGGDSFNFYDLNAKTNVQLSQRSRVFASFYAGQDGIWSREKYDFDGPGVDESGYYRSSLGWGNYTGTVRWSSVLGPKLFAN